MQIILVQTVAALGSISTLNLTLKLSLSTSHTHLLTPAISNYKGNFGLVIYSNMHTILVQTVAALGSRSTLNFT